MPCKVNRSVSRILYPEPRRLRSQISITEVGMTIIPLAQPLPVGSSDLPGGLRRAALISPPYLVLHREEFAWPRMSPHAPVRSYYKPFWAAPFHPSPRIGAGLFSVALVVAR